MDRLINALSNLFHNKTKHPSDIDINMLGDSGNLIQPRNIEKMSPILTHEEIQHRLDLIRATGYAELDTTMPNTQWTALTLSIVMIMPISSLERLCSPDCPAFQPCRFTSIDQFIVLFLQGKRDDSSIKPANASPEETKPAESKQATCTRREAESDKAKEYDGVRCVLTGTSDPEGCHILPFSINSSPANLNRLLACNDIRWLLDRPGRGVPAHLHIMQSVACSDYSWNIISVNRQMHKWWSEGFWGFKCLGVTPPLIADDSIGIDKGKEKEKEEVPHNDTTTPVMPAMGKIRLQFFWTKKKPKTLFTTETHDEETQSYWRRTMELDEAFDLVADWKRKETWTYNNNISKHTAEAEIGNLRVQEGTIIELERPYQDCVKMKVMIDLQYAAIQIANMSGAAYSDEYRNRDIEAEMLEARRRRDVPWPLSE